MKEKKNSVRKIAPPWFEFHFKDMLQVIIGASILAIPVGFTEETWRLGESLPLLNIMLLMVLSIFFVAIFTYYHYHHGQEESSWPVLFERVFLTYFFAFVVVSVLLTLINAAPWTTDFLLAFKRAVIVTFPSTMSAAIVDVLK